MSEDKKIILIYGPMDKKIGAHMLHYFPFFNWVLKFWCCLVCILGKLAVEMIKRESKVRWPVSRFSAVYYIIFTTYYM